MKVRSKTGVLFDGLSGVPRSPALVGRTVITFPLPQQRTGSSFPREGDRFPDKGAAK